MKRTILFCFFLLIGNSIFAQTLHLYGGDNHDVYLGCLNCSDIDSKSIWNDIGTYGSDISSNSIWNDIGTYGSDISSYSPWNDIGSNPPVVVDKNGNFYGYLTTNDIKSNRAEFELALILYEYYEQIIDDVDGWYERIFE